MKLLTMKEELFIEIARITQLATDGPWASQVTDDGYLRVTVSEDDVNGICGFGDMEEVDKKDVLNASFIANARTFVPVLLFEIRVLSSKLTQLERIMAEDYD